MRVTGKEERKEKGCEMVREEVNIYGMVIMFYACYVGLVKEKEREEQGNGRNKFYMGFVSVGKSKTDI